MAVITGTLGSEMLIGTAQPVVEIHPDRIVFEQGSYRRAPGSPSSAPVSDWRGKP